MGRIIRCALALGLLAALPAPLLGQRVSRAALLQPTAERPAFDYFVSRYDGESSGGRDDAVGGRLMWPLAAVAPASRWLSRTYLGAYLVHSPDDTDPFQSWRYGAQADLRLADRPVAGRVEPLLSLGVGASRLEWETRTPAPLRSELGGYIWRDQSRTVLSVTPGVGFRVLLAPGFGLRGDARQVLDFNETLDRNVEFSGGLSIGV